MTKIIINCNIVLRADVWNECSKLRKVSTLGCTNYLIHVLHKSIKIYRFMLLLSNRHLTINRTPIWELLVFDVLTSRLDNLIIKSLYIWFLLNELDGTIDKHSKNLQIIFASSLFIKYCRSFESSSSVIFFDISNPKCRSSIENSSFEARKKHCNKWNEIILLFRSAIRLWKWFF